MSEEFYSGCSCADYCGGLDEDNCPRRKLKQQLAAVTAERDALCKVLPCTASECALVTSLQDKLAAVTAERDALKKDVADLDKLVQAKIDKTNIPCADALDFLWDELLLKNKPNYGPWEYPGQAARHIAAEFNELTAERDNLHKVVQGIIAHAEKFGWCGPNDDELEACRKAIVTAERKD